MTGMRLAALVGGLIAGFSTCARAQETIVWSDVDCAQSKLVIPAGLKCRSTNTVGTRGAPTSTGGGQVKYWSASGILQQVKLYYYVNEIVSMTSNVKVGQLVDDIRLISPQAKSASNMSGLEKKGDADLVTFNNSQNDNCVGIRKYGSSRGGGYSWVLYATRCTPPARKASDADVSAFIAGAGFRP
jgi:hypothetical protein